MDEKDKLIKEQRAEISELRDKLDSMKKLAEIWNDWKIADEELPDYDQAFLVLWKVSEWKSARHLFWEILEWDEKRGWMYNELMQKEKARGNTIEIVYWKELPDSDTVEELMEVGL